MHCNFSLTSNLLYIDLRVCLFSLGILISQLETEKTSNTETAVRKVVFNFRVLVLIFMQMIAFLNIY